MHTHDEQQPRADSPALKRSIVALPLHGGLPPTQQARVFDPPPKGLRKVVCATNVAETSITIDDCTVVIDWCRVKELAFDATRGITRLKTTMVSRASAQQRRGRAGRVQPGVCFRLVTRAAYEGLAAHTPPEMCRVPLQGLCLQIKVQSCWFAWFCMCVCLCMMHASPTTVDQHVGRRSWARTQTLRPSCNRRLPHPQPLPFMQVPVRNKGCAPRGACMMVAITSYHIDRYQRIPSYTIFCLTAIDTLLAVGALTPHEAPPHLTGLGSHLAALPMDVHVAKMLVFGCMLHCVSPVLTIAAAMSYGRPMFVAPSDKRAEVGAFACGFA